MINESINNETVEISALETETEIIEKKEKKTNQTSSKSNGSGKPKTGTAVNSRYVQIRKAPSASSQNVGFMNSGDRAKILDRVPGYYKIQTEKDDHIGYVSSNYFEED